MRPDAATCLTALVLFLQISLRAQPGSLDTSFNPGSLLPGATQISVNAVAVQPDGKIVLGANFLGADGKPGNRVLRLNADGSGDTAFNYSGNFSANQIVIQKDGRLIVAGDSDVLRLNTDGTPDTNFKPPILSFVGGFPVVSSAALQADGKVVITGSFRSLQIGSPDGLMRLNTNGTLDRTFSPSVALGNIRDSNAKVITLADGKLLLGPGLTTATPKPILPMRLKPNGSFDVTFNAPSNVTVLLTVQRDGKIITGVRSGMVRLTEDGALDSTFATVTVEKGATNGYPLPTNVGQISSVAEQQDGKLVVAGSFGLINGLPRFDIARLNPDGTVDTTFDAGSGATGPFPDGTQYHSVGGVALQPDGRILAHGFFTNFNGRTVPGIVRLYRNDATGSNPPPAPMLTKPTIDRGKFTLSLLTTNSARYTLEFKDSVNETAWLSGETISGDGGEIILTDFEASVTQRFYRVRVE